ncbi:hypothetical protein Psfp_03020 [Pelotomaculum sp. FP]|nr:hypothetical protein Psfp_03020 [Pelotomaculum sp. FP]
MKILMVIVILLVPSTVLAGPQEQTFVPANVKVFINKKQILFDEEPIIINNAILLPLREIAESLDATVKWNQSLNQVFIEKDDEKLILSLESNRVLYDRKLFVMEQAPIVINGHTMVSLRFITTALGTNLTWDEKNRTVNIVDNGNFAELQPAIGDSEVNADKYYKWYDVTVGPNSGPSSEEAKNYILKQGILNEVKDVQYTYIRFNEFGDSVTMVSGIDEDKQEKIIWLNKDRYTGDISIYGTALKNLGLSQETVISILQEKSINEASIKKLYIAPYYKDEIVWFVIAEQEDKQYYYCLDFFTGSVVVEHVLNKGE